VVNFAVPAHLDIVTLDKLARRLEDDVGYLVEHCVATRKHCYWALSRALFPVAESLAWLLCPNPSSQQTSAQLCWFLESVMGDVNPRYRTTARCLCQMWRHALAHSDEPPTLRHPDGRKLAWSVSLDCNENHLQVERHGKLKCLHFSVHCFYLDLLTVIKDVNQLSRVPEGTVYARYERWAELQLIGSERTEKGKAAAEMAELLDNFLINERKGRSFQG
jgi:hypothetical protein